ncbi:MAG: hypothetical protein ABI775_10890 [Pseudonocardiales bacterium]
MLTVLTSGKAAPGVTTSTWALALTWPRLVMAADCDPAGGDMAPGLLAGRGSTEHGLLSWSSSARRGIPAMTAATMFAQHVFEMPERREAWFMPGFGNATQGFSFTEDIWERLALALERSYAAIGRDAVVDAGRLVGDRGNWPILRAADHVLLTVRPSVRSVHAAQDVALKLRYELGDLEKVLALVIGSGPYPASEVAAALQIRLGGTLPDDRSVAAMLSDGASGSLARAMQRSPLMKAAADLGKRLVSASHADTSSYAAGAAR